MKTTKTVATQSGLNLEVETQIQEEQIEVSLHAPAARRCLLHWGVRTSAGQGWELPPKTVWPPETQPFGSGAVQTPFKKRNGQSQVTIRLHPSSAFAGVEFVLFFPDEGRWDNNGGRNYEIALGRPEPPQQAPLPALRNRLSGEKAIFERKFEVDKQGDIAVAVTQTEGRYRLTVLSNLSGSLLMHWGVARRSPHEWLLPAASMRGPETTVFEQHTAQTPFVPWEGFQLLMLEFPESEAPLGVAFVLKKTQDGGQWLKYRGGNFYVPIHSGLPKGGASGLSTSLTELADEIIGAEMGRGSWTLMHRFNLCHDFLDRVRHDLDGQALIYVWLRFSAIRQLTWQRNYNTQPRELAHAQDRLTLKLADVFRTEPETRSLVRLMLASLGRGGEGQRIRDEILAIMHRHHIKEVSGHFMEEWHQKMHNNTTPDDVVICAAYLEFLRSNGQTDRFYEVLQNGGVTRQRLESFERPIRSQPQFVPDLKDGLIHDLQHFLAILKATHSGTDFDTAVHAARGQLDEGFQGVLNKVWDHRNDPPEGLVGLINHITEARRRLSNRLDQDGGLRELLYLDLALEQLLRVSVERHIHTHLSGDQLADLIACVLENVTLTYEDPELAACSRHWERLRSLPRFSADWALHAKSVVDRIARALTSWIDRFYELLQPKAEYLGRGFHAESWTITLFSEEVVRGTSLGFVLSILLHHLDPLLRQAAHIGHWRIISRGGGAGKVVVVDMLSAVQGQRLDGPTVVVANKVLGDEEIPADVTAVIAPDVTDIVSHVAVRARNARVLFASCHDDDTLRHLKSLEGHFLQVEVNTAGDVIYREQKPEAHRKAAPPRRTRPTVAARSFTKYAVAMDHFDEKILGGKSCHLARLKGQLPDWIHLPACAAIPFGVFEKALSLSSNKEVAKRYQELAKKVAQDGVETLSALRETVLALTAPDELKEQLRQAMEHSSLAWPSDWERAWHCIKCVWASKWNERAFLSRKSMGLPHENLFMAVLIQSVVPADYAYVIHTVNPSTGNRDELLAEVVVGLGETLVGNHPGRALSFVYDKTSQKQTLLSYPGKSIALCGEGLIFRSDSNGEDLAGFAGAGLYDSVLLKEPRMVDVDYSEEPLVWDEEFRRKMLDTMARIGLEVERVTGAPQDIEGAVTQDQFYVVQTRPQVGLE